MHTKDNFHHENEANSNDIKGIIRKENGSVQKQGFLKQMLKRPNKFLSIGITSLFLLGMASGIGSTSSLYSNQGYFTTTYTHKKNENKKTNILLIDGIIKHIADKTKTANKMDGGAKLPIGITAYGIKLKDDYIHPYTLKTKEVEGIATINSISAKSGEASLQLNVTLMVDSNTIKYYWLQNVAVFNTLEKKVSFNDDIFPSNDHRYTQIHRDQIALGKGKLKYMFLPFEVSNIYIYFGKQLNYSLPTKNLIMTIEAEKEKGGILINFAYKYGSEKTSKPITKIFDRVFLKIKNIKSYSIEVSPYVFYINKSPNILNAEFVWGGAINGENAVFNSMSSTLDMLYRKDRTFHKFPLVFDFGYSTAETVSNISDHFNKNGIAVITKGKINLSHAQNN